MFPVAIPVHSLQESVLWLHTFQLLSYQSLFQTLNGSELEAGKNINENTHPTGIMQCGHMTLQECYNRGPVLLD